MDNRSESSKRRETLLTILKESSKPVSGTALSRSLGVSRQVIVQDVALLRASNQEILSTPRGYVLYNKEEAVFSRRFKVKHSSADLESELNIIVDQGAAVEDVIIEHPIYGEIHGNLGLQSRRDVAAFLQRAREQKGIPLLEMSDGIHYHIVTAHQEEVLTEVALQLEKAGFLMK